MKINKQENGLKGQSILAQGNALGLMQDEKIVRPMKLFKKLSLFRTKGMNSNVCPKIIECNSVRKFFFVLIIMFARTIFVVFPLPRALPWAELY